MKKIYILTCFVFLLTSIGMARPFSKEVMESKVKFYKQNVALLQQINQKAVRETQLKSISTQSRKLEKITFADGGWKEFNYNEDGQTIGFKSYVFNEGTGTVVLSEDNTFSYDGKGNRILQVFKTLKSDNLTVTEKDESEYDSQNRETLQLSSAYSDELGKLVNSSKTVTTYQSDGLIVENYLWDETAQNWILESKTEIELKNNILLKETNYSKSETTGEIVKSMIMEFTYNPNGSLQQTLTKMVDEETGQMVDFMKSVMSYDNNGNEILSLESMFESESGTWMEWSKTISNFNTNNELISDENYDLDWLTFQLSVSEKHEYSYANNKLIQQLVWQKLDQMGELSQSQKFEYSYDNSIDNKEVILPDSWIEHNGFSDVYSEFVFSFGTVSNIKWYDWDYTTETLKPFRDAIYHYSKSEGGVEVNTLITNSIKVGPNPFNGNLTITLSENCTGQISIYTLSGQKVYNTPVNNSKTISTSNWKDGIYMVQFLNENGERELVKLVKQ
jgi:hypothetical protein